MIPLNTQILRELSSVWKSLSDVNQQEENKISFRHTSSVNFLLIIKQLLQLLQLNLKMCVVENE